MFNICKKEIQWGGDTLTLETGRVARQASGSVLATYGETVLIASAVVAKTPKLGIDFFPLTINYQEKYSAAGKIPGGFFKREGRPGEKETLTCRLIDRPIRPLFPKGFSHETQIIIDVVSYDKENDPDILALVAASAALALSDAPFKGPIAAARVGYNPETKAYGLNTKISEKKDSVLDLIVAGTEEGVLMVESEASELSEDIMLGALEYGFKEFQPVIKMINEMVKEAGKDKMADPELPEGYDAAKAKVTEIAEKDLRAAYGEKKKQDRQVKISAVKDAVLAAMPEDDFDQKLISGLFKDLEKNIVRGDVLKTGERIDGRDSKTVRQIVAEAGILPRTHGSALFTRGETQALVSLTVGDAKERQRIETLNGEHQERFMLHYNFPPYSVGECGRVGSPGRREIGHGKLAWRSINPILPSWDEFPYSIRIISEITESNGSSSMASVCGSSLALMDAGCPLPRPVAGIAMGLIKEGDDFAVLSDILGDEDHLGDMDFKVAGTSEGITSLQMDIKITSITFGIMKTALAQAKDGRTHILGEMAKALDSARPEMSQHAPQTEKIKIKRDKIREVIGAGGRVIKGMVEETGAKIDIDDDGTVKVTGSKSSIAAAMEKIKAITEDPEVGKIYAGKVIKIFDFGAFVVFFGEKGGLVHISELCEEKVETVTDVVNIDDEVKVKVTGFDDRGRIRLSIKQATAELAEKA
ncbi:MAG: polyribonucleotide nucleotidyltransferase [Alphaproteobacteria bacterium]